MHVSDDSLGLSFEMSQDTTHCTFNGFQIEYVDSRNKPWQTKVFHKANTATEKRKNICLKKTEVITKVAVYHNQQHITALAFTVSGRKKPVYCGKYNGAGVKKIGAFEVPEGGAIIGFDWAYNRQGQIVQFLCSALG